LQFARRNALPVISSAFLAAARDSESGFMQRACPSVLLSVDKIQKRDFLKN